VRKRLPWLATPHGARAKKEVCARQSGPSYCYCQFGSDAIWPAICGGIVYTEHFRVIALFSDFGLAVNWSQKELSSATWRGSIPTPKRPLSRGTSTPRSRTGLKPGCEHPLLRRADSVGLFPELYHARTKVSSQASACAKTSLPGGDQNAIAPARVAKKEFTIRALVVTDQPAGFQRPG
jgi:hypothetical protein